MCCWTHHLSWRMYGEATGCLNLVSFESRFPVLRGPVSSEPQPWHPRSRQNREASGA